MYSNIFLLKCVYKEQEYVIKHCPEILKENISGFITIPEYFKKEMAELFK